jgi:hypothetical protein
VSFDRSKHTMRDRPTDEEPVILPLRLHQGPDAPPDHPDPVDPDEEDGFQAESYWAGRNHAMRFSARVAA